MNRNHWWDWLKICAALAMLIDHCRFVWPDLTLYFLIPGRFAMPIFAFIAARNFYSSSHRSQYLARLAPFAVASELPYFYLTGEAGNVLSLFFLSFAAMELSFIALILPASCCTYGLPGVAAIWLFTKKPEKLSVFVGGSLLNPFPIGFLSGVFSLLPLESPECRPAPLFFKNWLLWFYPVHLTVLAFGMRY